MLPPLQYFFPKYGKKDVPAGLGDVFEGRPLNRSQSTAHGPNGLKGTFFSYFEDTVCQFNETQQRWAKFKTIDDREKELEFFIVVDRHATPKDFIRETTLPGVAVELSLGSWVIPCANPLVESCVIPYFDMTNDGDVWYREYKEQYLVATEAAVEMAGQMRALIAQQKDGKEAFEMDDGDLRRLICIMIGVNYRLTLQEMVALRLFDSEKYLEMLYAFVDAEATMQLMLDETDEAANAKNPF